MKTQAYLSSAAKKLTDAQHVLSDAITEREPNIADKRTVESKAMLRELRRLRARAIDLRNEIEGLL